MSSQNHICLEYFTILEYIQKVGNMWLRRGRTQKIKLDLKYLLFIRTRCLPFTIQKDVALNTSKMEAVYGLLHQNGWPNRLENDSPCILKGYFDGSFLNFSSFPVDASMYLFLWDPKSPNEKGIDIPIE